MSQVASHFEHQPAEAPTLVRLSYTQEAHGVPPCGIPAWILFDARSRIISRPLMISLRAMADQGQPDECGIMDIIGGSTLAQACGVTVRTLRRHVAALIANGYLVIQSAGDHQSPHTYAIPCHRGSLDHLADHRPVVSQTLVPGVTARDGRPKRIPQRIRSGGQTAFWTPPKPDDGTGGVRTGCPHPIGQDVRTPIDHGVNHGVIKNHDRGACAKKYEKSDSGSKRRPWLRGVVLDDLRDDHRLADLLDRAIREGVGRFAGVKSDDLHVRLQWWSMAAHCLRIGEDPASLFASHISRDTGWLFISQADEDAALRRLKPAREPRTANREPRPIHHDVVSRDTDADRWSAMSSDDRHSLIGRLWPKLTTAQQCDLQSGRLSGAILIQLARERGVKP